MAVGLTIKEGTPTKDVVEQTFQGVRRGEDLLSGIPRRHLEGG